MGGSEGIRGFAYFERYGREILTAQLEFRGRMGPRFGYVAFAGAGDVRRAIFGENEGQSAAVGLGFRYRVSREYGVDMSLDVTVNDAEETPYYLYVGQAF